VSVLIEYHGKTVSGSGVSTDILEASGRAYLRALTSAIEDSPVAKAEHHLEEAVRTPAP
jgi:hypothetical protein